MFPASWLFDVDEPEAKQLSYSIDVAIAGNAILGR